MSENTNKSITEFRKPEEMLTIELLQEEFDKVYLLADRGVLKVLSATVVANKMDLDPVWLFLVGPSSGGKTEMINALESLEFVHPIDTMTVNTFASGQKRPGKETSLLLRINDGIITYKDFTAILEMNKDARREIMGQLRCIFDGKFVKRTGTGDDIHWQGKLGMVAAVTSIIHEKAAEFAVMGERFIQYEIAQPDRKQVSRRVFSNAHGMDAKRMHLQQCFKFYIEHVIQKLDDIEIELAADLKEEILDVADFATKARSGLVKNERKPEQVQFKPDAEMPMRVTGQLFTLASALIGIDKTRPQYLSGNKAEGPVISKLSDDDKKLIYKICLDSIPRKRRLALQSLAKYRHGITTAGLAIKLSYHSDVMKATLFELNALELCDRRRDGGVDIWHLKEDYRDTICKYEGITAIDDKLQADDDVEDYSETNTNISESFISDSF